MTPELHAQLAPHYQILGGVLMRALPQGWRDGEITIKREDGVFDIDASYVGVDGARQSAADAIEDLAADIFMASDAMAQIFEQAGQDAWTGFCFSLAPDGQFRCDFYYDQAEGAAVEIILDEGLSAALSDAHDSLSTAIQMAAENTYFGARLVWQRTADGSDHFLAENKRRDGGLVDFLAALNGRDEFHESIATITGAFENAGMVFSRAEFSVIKSQCTARYFSESPAQNTASLGRPLGAKPVRLRLPMGSDLFDAGHKPHIQAMLDAALPFLDADWRELRIEARLEDDNGEIRLFVTRGQNPEESATRKLSDISEIIYAELNLIRQAFIDAGRAPWERASLFISSAGDYRLDFGFSENAQQAKNEDAPLVLDPALRERLKPIEKSLIDIARPLMPAGWKAGAIRIMLYDGQGDIDVEWQDATGESHDLPFDQLIPVMKDLVAGAKKLRSAFLWAEQAIFGQAVLSFTPQQGLASCYFAEDEDEDE